jgi:hypothetical protein
MGGQDMVGGAQGKRQFRGDPRKLLARVEAQQQKARHERAQTNAHANARARAHTHTHTHCKLLARVYNTLGGASSEISARAPRSRRELRDLGTNSEISARAPRSRSSGPAFYVDARERDRDRDRERDRDRQTDRQRERERERELHSVTTPSLLT